MGIDVVFGSSRYLKYISLLRIDPSLNVNASASKMSSKCQPSNTEQNKKIHSKNYVQKKLTKIYLFSEEKTIIRRINDYRG